MSAYVSAFELFSIGVGPSSSHTVGPLRAGRDFAARIHALPGLARVTCALYGSLGATGIGHGTPDAVVAGLQGTSPRRSIPISCAAPGPTGATGALSWTADARSVRPRRHRSSRARACPVTRTR
jgi:L-serine dehydratase